MIDNLTQLDNRETFFEILAEHIVSVHNNKIKLALLVIDINRFERINSLYDYSVGDLVLKQFFHVNFHQCLCYQINIHHCLPHCFLEVLQH